MVALVPAYNEAGRIGQVLAVLRDLPEITEVVVINDGSRDATGQEAEAARVADPRLRVVHHQVNQGKGQALETGVAEVAADYLLLLDADLRDLEPRHVRALCEPVLAGQADMSVGLFRGGRWNTDLAHRLTPWLSGQRCLRASLWRDVCPTAAQGYGVEAALTVAARQNHWRVAWVAFDGVHHPPCESHRGPFHGVLTRGRMYRQVVRAWYLSSRWRRELRQLNELHRM
ncbi:MAG: glycosyltransferase family 2 protein [Armatimonadetes bacterium]|nr:glycosyltransferase family 2 protein [Armatimonadota bacterium]